MTENRLPHQQFGPFNRSLPPPLSNTQQQTMNGHAPYFPGTLPLPPGMIGNNTGPSSAPPPPPAPPLPLSPASQQQHNDAPREQQPPQQQQHQVQQAVGNHIGAMINFSDHGSSQQQQQVLQRRASVSESQLPPQLQQVQGQQPPQIQPQPSQVPSQQQQQTQTHAAQQQQQHQQSQQQPLQHAQIAARQQQPSLSEREAQQQQANAAARAAEAGYRPLNVKDALSYLDQVKIQFFDQPDVYNRFLDIMKDFKSQTIDTPGVIERVSTLFRGHPNLVQGFNTFLPPGYRIECSLDPSDPNPIRVTTPQGTVNQVNGQNGGPTRFSAPVQIWRNEDAFAANAAYGMAMVSQAASSQAQSGEKKGPVEFNHAINYVNKIKNRFSNEPDTYKHFLEILQTYQKEAKPIQEVYAQVTILFKGAPDLLDDFKQFLPENNAGGPRLPPVGNFAPPIQQTMPSQIAANGREKKKRAVDPPARQATTKRTKTSHNKLLDVGPISPSLIPSAPEPLGPAAARAGNTDELAFFDKARKHIGNRNAFNEFLKVINLFTQDIIDRNILVERVDSFLGSNRDLMEWFKHFVGYTGLDENIENVPAVTRPKVDLSLCKAFGPSYRQLPRSETLLPCSGRDGMCWEVLNDEFVSHPTWASEDAGFVAHRKNQYEEALHKIEEERYEYDLNIEANLRTIQLLEPIAQRISNMSDDEKRLFRLPPGLGGQSISIYQKVIKKVYDRERGAEVIEALHENPAVAIPIVLKRLKQKDEEWKRAQREWNKVWRETEAKNYYKSLDHQGIFFKTNDKKAMTVRTFVTEIDTLRRVQKEKRINPATPKPRFQYDFDFSQDDVILDVSRLIGCQMDRMQVNANEREKMSNWLETFLPLFFGISKQRIINSVGGATEDLAEEEPTTTGVSTRRKKAGHEVDLLKTALKKQREKVKQDKKDGRIDDLEGQISRQSTPVIDQRMSDGDNDNVPLDAKQTSTSDDSALSTAQKAGEVWIQHNVGGIASSKNQASSQHSSKNNLQTTPGPTKSDVNDSRSIFNCFSNVTFYCFFRWFQMLYSRLAAMKKLEAEATAELKTRKPNPIAIQLGLNMDRLANLNIVFNEDTDHYEQLLVLCERLIEQDIDQAMFEDAMRYIYGTKGYKLYTVDKIVNLLHKQIHAIVTDPKNVEITTAFQKDRTKLHTTTREQIIYRIQVESVLGPEEQLFRNEWDDKNRVMHVQLIGKDDLTLDNAVSREEVWSYYIDSYILSTATEGVPLDQIRPPVLQRLLSTDDSEADLAIHLNDTYVKSDLEIKICVNTYKMFFMSGSEDVFLRKRTESTGAVDQIHDMKEKRKDRWRNWLEDRETGWKREVQGGESKYREAEDKLQEAFAKSHNAAADPVDVSMSGV